MQPFLQVDSLTVLLFSLRWDIVAIYWWLYISEVVSKFDICTGAAPDAPHPSSFDKKNVTGSSYSCVANPVGLTHQDESFLPLTQWVWGQSSTRCTNPALAQFLGYFAQFGLLWTKLCIWDCGGMRGGLTYRNEGPGTKYTPRNHA